MPLGNQLAEKSTMRDKIKIRWLTNASFEIDGCGEVIVTDPCLKQSTCNVFNADSFKRVDHVLVSHMHWDHITELPDIEKKFHPNIFTGALGADLLATWLDCNTSFIYPMFPNQELNMGKVSIKMIYNRHANVNKKKSEQEKKNRDYDFMSHYPGLEKLQSMGGMEMCSFLITFENEFRILFWGGNVSQNQISTLRGLHPDVALMQYTKQGPIHVSELANAIGPSVLIPHHHDLKVPFHDEITQEKLKLLKECYKGKLICPENGQWLEF